MYMAMYPITDERRAIARALLETLSGVSVIERCGYIVVSTDSQTTFAVICSVMRDGAEIVNDD